MTSHHRLLALLLLLSCLASSWSAAAGPSPNNAGTLLLSPSDVETLLADATGADQKPSGVKPDITTKDEANDKWMSLPAGIYWTDMALEMITKYQQNPLRAARTLSYLHVAMYDANTVAQQLRMSAGGQQVVMHLTGASILELFYSQETEGRFMALATEASTATTGLTTNDRARALVITRAVLQAARQRAATDGADAIWSVANRPKPRPGLWQAAPPLNIYRPLEPLAGQWKPWFLVNASEVSAPPPVQYDSENYWAEAQKVLDIATKLTPAQKKIAEDWHLGQGTVTPAGVWNLKARELVLEQKLDATTTARLFAHLNATLFDAFLACWEVKFRYWTERPVTAIRSRIDPDFLPYLVTPPFPSYVSGHATVSGAAAEILSVFFPKKRAQLTAMAEEAALSRLYGGIHFESDNNEGLALGRKVGQKAIASW